MTYYEGALVGVASTDTGFDGSRSSKKHGHVFLRICFMYASLACLLDRIYVIYTIYIYVISVLKGSRWYIYR